ncbi:MAG: hypothetical protein K0Q95_859 [Bacteroidota bacterium]|jgi:hypothetical protein|nr:hypothetical protein [Bacteroidota bacterium]
MIRTQAIRLIALHFFCVFFGHSYSQQRIYKDSVISSKINTLEGFWKKYNELSNRHPKFENTSIISDLYKVNSDANSRTGYLNAYDEARLKKEKLNFGLSAVGSYQQNFNPGLGDDELVYNRRLQAGLDWNILADGYLSSRYKQQIIKNEKIINSLKPAIKISASDYLNISHKIIFAFNTHKIKLLEERQQIIDDKLDVANELYLMKHLQKLDLMQIIQQQVDVSSMFQIYRAYNDQLKNEFKAQAIPVNIFPLFDLDIERLQNFSYNNGNDSILKLLQKNLELENKFWKEINLKTQVRYNYYDITNANLSNRDFLSAGLSVSVPLPLGSKASRDVVNTKMDLIRFDQKIAGTEQNSGIINSVYEFRYKLKQYNNFYEKHKKYEELIRIERVKEKFNDLEFNPVTALNLLDEMLSVEIEMLDLQQEMYLQLLDLITKTPDADVLSLVKEFSVNRSEIPGAILDRSIYIWSDVQMKYDENYILEYLHLNKISNAIISVRKDGQNKLQASAVISKLSAAGITTEVMIGSNELLSDKDPVNHMEKTLSGLDLSKTVALHLDVEPHTLADWQEKKEEHLTNYIALLGKAKSLCSSKGLKLNVSIPVFYPEETLKKIYELSDNVYLMAYEHADADFITRKVKEEFSNAANRTVIALRAADFKNRNEFEKLITELSAGLNTTRFAMHDLGSFIKLDELNVGGDK